MVQLAPGEVLADRVTFDPRETGEVTDEMVNPTETGTVAARVGVGVEVSLAGLAV
jgi:hypothetical protein